MIRRLRYWLYRLHFNHPALFNHKPSHLDLELVRSCNLQCPFCYRQENGFTDKFPHKLMDIPAAVKNLNKYYDLGCRSVKFNWRGEPTMHMSLGTIARIAKQIGYLDIMINTNLANSVFCNTLFGVSLDYFTEIRVSLDTMQSKLYERMRYPAKLDTTLDNLAELIKLYNSKKTKIIIQRRTSSETENDAAFYNELWGEMYKRSKVNEIARTLEKKVRIISKPIQPRVNLNLNYSNGEKHADEIEMSYFDQWQAGLIGRKYCKQPSQRIVVGVDGKEWRCCLAYNEPFNLLINDGDSKLLIKRLNDPENYKQDRSSRACSEPYIPHECYYCTSFTAYKVKR
jgi:molybdenum cofactor biosynthesis enzyme MoaA